MQEHELVLSDVHLRHSASSSTFEYRTASSLISNGGRPVADADGDIADGDIPVRRRLEADADGDIPVRRRLEADADGGMCTKRRRSSDVRSLVVTHSSDGTTLADVGLQVWRGALLLCDWLVHHSDRLVDPDLVVLELGAGCGLCGCLAAQLGARVYLTDVGDAILRNAAANVAVNDVASRATVRRFDWFERWAPEAWAYPALAHGELGASVPSAFEWQPADRDALLAARRVLVLAADCVYDDHLTDALIDRVSDLVGWLAGGEHAPRWPEGGEDAPKEPAGGDHVAGHVAGRAVTVVFSLERRINFCLDSLSARAPAAEHFHRRLHAIGTADAHEGAHDGATGLECHERRAVEIPQAFDYERSRELRLHECVVRPARGAPGSTGLQ